MLFQLWMLLFLPLFFAMGWLAARIDIKEIVAEGGTLPASYFQGLNFLLNEQQDKAIEAFIDVVKVDPQTIELHFALGSLFRRRGEVDRALRMHHNLVDRADLSDIQRQQAVFELAQDYLKAGILDRAENLFRELEKSAYAQASFEFLLELFQKEHDWQKAILLVQAHSLESKVSYHKEIAFFYCEIAAENLTSNDLLAAQQSLQMAFQSDAKAVRASIMLGDIYSTQSKVEQALQVWQSIEQQDPQYLPLVAERVLAAYCRLDKEAEGVALLRDYLSKYHAHDLLNVVFSGVQKSEGSAAAYQLVRDELERNPSLLGLDKLLEARLLDVPLDKRADLELVKNLVHKRTRNLALYHCKSCGFKAQKFYWHCPACQAWDSYSPRRTEETGSTL
jgi:lipopolysaccharide assembly protein B